MLGSTFYIDGGNMAPGSLMLRLIGIHPLATPWDLGPLGAPGRQVEVDSLDRAFVFADATGSDYWPLTSPIIVGLIGLPIQQQIAVLDLSANAPGAVVSNRVSSVFGIEN